MKSRRSSRTSRPGRRGHTLVEISISSGIALVGLAALASTLSVSGRLEQQVQLQTDTSETAALAMQRMVMDIREAKRVDVPAAHRVRVYYPVRTANGQF